MRLLRRKSSMGGGGGGGRGLRRVVSLPRSPMALSLAPRASLAKTESIKKRDKNNNKGSKRARLRAGLSAALHLGGGHRRAGRRGGGGDEGAGAVSSAAAPGVAVLLRAAADDADERPAAAAANVGHGGRDHASGGRGRSWRWRWRWCSCWRAWWRSAGARPSAAAPAPPGGAAAGRSTPRAGDGGAA